MATQLVSTLLLLYRMNDADVAALAATLNVRRIEEYKRAIQQELARYGCNAIASAPSGGDLAALQQMSQRDAETIAVTYNGQLERQIQRLYDANPRGNRQYYYSNLEAWSNKRDGFKVPQIALQTAQTTREHAQRRFRDKNQIGGKYLFAGPPPVCKKCMRLRAMGLVTIDVVNQYGNSQHIGCPHEWQSARLSKIDCSRVWTGG